MNIIVTGSTGFVGRHLLPKLIDKGHHILEITIEPEVSEELYGTKTQKYLISDDQVFFKMRLEDFKPDAVIHLASYLTSADDYQTLQKLLNTNIVFYCRLLDALRNSNLKLFVNTGTFAEFFKGDEAFEPAYLYAATKTATRSFLDYYSKVFSFKQATVVPYTIYGGNDTQKKIIDIIFDSIQSPTSVDLSPGNQVLDFIHVDDVTDFYCRLIEYISELPQKSNFKLGTGKGHTLKQLAGIIEEVTQQKTNICWGGKSYRNSDVKFAIADISSTSKILNWFPKISLQLGLEHYFNQIKKAT